MVIATYSFKRGSGRYAAITALTVNTDARNALADWANAHSTRSFEVVGDDDDDQLIAVLSFPERDSRAGRDLDRACNAHGVQRGTVEAGE